MEGHDNFDKEHTLVSSEEEDVMDHDIVSNGVMN